MKIINMRERIRNLVAKRGPRGRRDLAAAVVAGGMLFSGATAQGADIVVNGGFEIAAGDPGSGWTNQGSNYTHPYGGIFGPQLTEVGTLTDYGFDDDISADAGSSFHGLTFPTTQTIDLVNVDLTAQNILDGEGRYAFSAWLAACCNDVPKITAQFNDVGATSVSFNRGIDTFLTTSADVLVNPGGPNNSESLGVLQDSNRRYWALYEFKGSIPADATQVTLTVDDGRADASAQGASTGGNGNDNYVDMVIFDAVQSTVVINDPVLKIIVDRDNGNITLSNGTGVAQDIKGYSILSDAGALDETSASFMADSDSNWVQFSEPGARGDLSEGHLTTDSLGVGETFSLGNAWIKYFDDNDLSFEYLNGAGELVGGLVRYTGSTVQAPFDFGDLDFDGDVDSQDWVAYAAGLGTDLSGMTDAQSYPAGDMNGDQANNHADFLLFQDAYDDANGAGAFAAMIAQVPEPATLVLVALSGLTVGCSRGTGRRLSSDGNKLKALH